MHRIFSTAFADVYPHYVTKVEKKGRTVAELHEVLRWITGFGEDELARHLAERTTFADLFEAARMPQERELITGSICGVKVQEIEDPLMRKLRQLDKVVDELAKGKAVEKVIRSAA